METAAEADNMAGEGPEIDENDDSVAEPPSAAANEGVKRKTGSRGERNRKFYICKYMLGGGCGGGHIIPIDHRKYEIRNCPHCKGPLL